MQGERFVICYKTTSASTAHALRVVLLNVPRVGRSYALFPDVQGETVQDIILRVPFCKVFPSDVGIPPPHTSGLGVC